jgi:hypothetical protein
MKKRWLMGLGVAGLVLFLVGVASPASADSVSFNFPGTVAASPVSGIIAFLVPSANNLIVDITDTQANPRSVGQLISDISFTASGTTGPATVMSSSGQKISIAKKTGIAILGPVCPMMWGINNSGSTITLSAPISGPSNSIIGPAGAGGVYINADGSIAGNHAHNPFATGMVAFDLSVPGLDAVTQWGDLLVSLVPRRGMFFPSRRPPARLPSPAL